MADGQHPAELLVFPCVYEYKVFGDNDVDGAFVEAVYRAVNQVLPVARDALRTRASANGRYLCVSVLVRVDNMRQVETLYATLKGVEGLRYLL